MHKLIYVQSWLTKTIPGSFIILRHDLEMQSLKKWFVNLQFVLWNIYADVFCFFMHKWQWSALLSKKLNFLTQQEEVRLSERDYTSSHNTNDSDYSAKRTSSTVCPRQHVSVEHEMCQTVVSDYLVSLSLHVLDCRKSLYLPHSQGQFTIHAFYRTVFVH